ncbi:hypothetical protein [Peptostreptococcus canis]|uniref:Sigma factor regulator C-terminal domain-containing protein n=1 Tax=Peptostreptococcus canis TaxID=1159213 RepID=A0ABR6TKH2_9FIRM|nr:hypothetical protein [Peptostreptococcus canis]MBC2575908.1 hypothetical protein [Peptostreptococcus canis]MBP1997971.1 hypothetical protein [Peptostreptococcus canis]
MLKENKNMEDIIDSFKENDNFSFSKQEIDYEKELDKKIAKQIKMLILKGSLKTILILIIVLISILCVINPVIKSMYPDFYNLENKGKNISFVDNFKQRYFGINVPIVFNQNESTSQAEIDKQDDENNKKSKLSMMLYNFSTMTEPFIEYRLLRVVDKNFGKYYFDINAVNSYTQNLVVNDDIDKKVMYIRGNTKEIQSYKKSGHYLPQYLYPDYLPSEIKSHNEETIKNINDLPDSTQFNVVLYTKQLEPIYDLTKYLLNKYENYNIIWMPVIDTKAYNKLDSDVKKHIENPDTNYSIFKLGIKLRRNLYFTSTDYSIIDDFDKYNNKKIKDYYINHLNLMKNNPAIFDVFFTLNRIAPHYTNSGGLSTSYFADNRLKEQLKEKYDSDIYEKPEQFYNINSYIDNITKEKVLKTNSFVAKLSKKELLNILKDEKINTLTILHTNLSIYSE